jgi:hypothetical protein
MATFFRDQRYTESLGVELLAVRLDGCRLKSIGRRALTMLTEAQEYGKFGMEMSILLK